MKSTRKQWSKYVCFLEGDEKINGKDIETPKFKADYGLPWRITNCVRVELRLRLEAPMAGLHKEDCVSHLSVWLEEGADRF